MQAAIRYHQPAAKKQLLGSSLARLKSLRYASDSIPIEKMVHSDRLFRIFRHKQAITHNKKREKDGYPV